MTMAERPHLSISEVLTLLREEFADITVSKIRFLESQGLIDPQRTPSGYRKFYEPDVERLRWILRQQREHYLPLKVIKGRLGQFQDGANGAPAAVASPTRHAPATERAVASAPLAAAPQPRPLPGTPAAARATARSIVPDEPLDDAPSLTGASFTRPELLRASGLDDHQLSELESFGILPRPREFGHTKLYDEEALEVARLARGFFAHGVESRHLKMYKVAAEREAAFFAQVVSPMLKQRNPHAKRQALDTATELARLGRALRNAMLRMSLPATLGE
jgi:DNA-binding transcriptional MerR regulator